MQTRAQAPSFRSMTVRPLKEYEEHGVQKADPRHNVWCKLDHCRSLPKHIGEYDCVLSSVAFLLKAPFPFSPSWAALSSVSAMCVCRDATLSTWIVQPAVWMCQVDSMPVGPACLLRRLSQHRQLCRVCTAGVDWAYA